jgi:hypothetical protein
MSCTFRNWYSAFMGNVNRGVFGYCTRWGRWTARFHARGMGGEVFDQWRFLFQKLWNIWCFPNSLWQQNWTITMEIFIPLSLVSSFTLLLSEDREVEIIHQLRVKILTFSPTLSAISSVLGELDWYLPGHSINKPPLSYVCSGEIPIHKTLYYRE